MDKAMANDLKNAEKEEGTEGLIMSTWTFIFISLDSEKRAKR
jgi:hypothetical protein